MSGHSIVIPPKLGQWVAYALILLAPGSFFVLPALWLARRFVGVARRQALRRACLRASAELWAIFKGLANGPCASAPRRSP